MMSVLWQKKALFRMSKSLHKLSILMEDSSLPFSVSNKFQPDSSRRLLILILVLASFDILFSLF